MASSFGQLFRITTWGESHGGGVGVVVDGCPPRLKLSEADIQPDLDRRRPGQSKIVTPRKESDTIQILSGISNGKTLGTPICLWVKNEDARPEAYSEMKTKFRPSHADFTYFAKYGIRAWAGASPPARLRRKFCAKNSAWKRWLTSSKSRKFRRK
jgi:chorismate synthase